MSDDRECNDPGKACGADHHCNREAEEGSDADSHHSVDSGVGDSSGLPLSQLDDEDNIDNRPEQVAPGTLPPSPGGFVNHHLQHVDSHNLNASKIESNHQQDQNQGASLELNTEGASRTPDLKPRGECSSCLGYNHGHCFKCHNDQYIARNSVRVDPQGLASSADDNFRKQLDGKHEIIYTPSPPESDTGHVAHTVLQTYIPGDTCGETLENVTLLQNQSPGSSDVVSRPNRPVKVDAMVAESEGLLTQHRGNNHDESMSRSEDPVAEDDVFDKPESSSTPDPRDYLHEPVPTSESSGNSESIPSTSTSDYESNRGDQSSEAPKRKRKPNKSLRKVARNIIKRFSVKTRKVPKKKKVPTATLR